MDAEAEEFLWSLGVGDQLPDWLKELRKRERTKGQNQGLRKSATPAPRVSPEPSPPSHAKVRGPQAYWPHTLNFRNLGIWKFWRGEAFGVPVLGKSGCEAREIGGLR